MEDLSEVVFDHRTPFISIDPVTSKPIPTTKTPIDISGTITDGGEAQVLDAARTGRSGYSIYNPSLTESLWHSDVAEAVAGSPSKEVPPGAEFVTEPGVCGAGVISIIGQTTGQVFTARVW